MIINFIIKAGKWIEDIKSKSKENDEKYKQRFKEEGGLNINVVEDCKNWVTEKLNLLFNLISAKTKPG